LEQSAAMNTIKRRWGQWACFGFGFMALAGGSDNGSIETTAAGCVLMATGLGLRAIAVWREAQ
jgi:hypothetical protein